MMNPGNINIIENPGNAPKSSKFAKIENPGRALKDLAHSRNRPFAKTVIEGKISLEVMNFVCVRLLNEALCSAMRICVVSGYI